MKLELVVVIEGGAAPSRVGDDHGVGEGGQRVPNDGHLHGVARRQVPQDACEGKTGQPPVSRYAAEHTPSVLFFLLSVCADSSMNRPDKDKHTLTHTHTHGSSICLYENSSRPHSRFQNGFHLK